MKIIKLTTWDEARLLKGLNKLESLIDSIDRKTQQEVCSDMNPLLNVTRPMQEVLDARELLTHIVKFLVERMKKDENN